MSDPTRAVSRLPVLVRVLLADSDHDERTVYREIFRRAGCDVLEAADGREALVTALVRNPSLIVLDTRLPLVNSAAVCEILRRDALTRQVPILALVDGGSAGDADRIRRAGADVVVAKPVDPDALLTESRRLTSELAVGRTRDDAPAYDAPPRETVRSGKRIAISKTHPRFATTSPPSPPPALRCPRCDGTLTYECSHVGGVSDRYAEQWDDFTCSTCGAFEYRHRTRRLRPRDVTS
jgi:CheY-like chemotaxis protein